MARARLECLEDSKSYKRAFSQKVLESAFFTVSRVL